MKAKAYWIQEGYCTAVWDGVWGNKVYVYGFDELAVSKAVRSAILSRSGKEPLPAPKTLPIDAVKYAEPFWDGNDACMLVYKKMGLTQKFRTFVTIQVPGYVGDIPVYYTVFTRNDGGEYECNALGDALEKYGLAAIARDRYDIDPKTGRTRNVAGYMTFPATANARAMIMEGATYRTFAGSFAEES